MNNLSGANALLTGASGGLGVPLAEVLAEAGMNLALVSYPGAEMATLMRSLSRHGVRTMALEVDLRNRNQYRGIVEQVLREFPTVDVLINNAGVEYSSPYHLLKEEAVKEVLSVNLEAPMMLSRLVLPGMVERRRGHIVNISSLAGKSGPAFQEPYTATKAGLISFTASLRATYHGSGVSASVIVPGFFEAGIYARIKAKIGRPAPALLAALPPQRVARAVIRAIRHDLPEVLVTRYPVRPILAVSALFPSVGEWLAHRIGVHDFFRRVVEAEQQQPENR